MVATLTASASSGLENQELPEAKKKRGEKKEKKLCNLQGEVRQVVSLVVKSQLQCRQKIAAIEGALFDTLLGEEVAGDPLVLGMSEQTSLYSREVKEKGRGHGLGPPHIWAFGGLGTSLVKLGGRVGASTAEKIKGFMEEYDQMSVADKCEAVRYCRLSTTYKSTDRRITLCLAPCHPVRHSLLKAMEELKWERKFGKAPKNFMERELQEWLEVLADKK